MPRRPLPRGPFTLATARAAGLTAWEIRRHLRRVLHGVYVRPDVQLGDRVRAAAALLLAPEGSYLSHHSAARHLGGVVPDDPDVHVSSPGTRPKVDGIAAHRAKPDQAVIRFRGVLLTSPAQTFVDLGRLLGLVDLVVLGDSLVRAGRVTPAALRAAAAEAGGPGSRLARPAAGLVRERVDSPMETRLRLLIVLAGLPEPVVDHRVRRADGTVVYRFDLAYVEYRLAIEYDGWQHADDPGQWHSDIDRDEQLDEWRVRRLVVVSNDIYQTPGRTLQRVIRAMRERGMPVPRLRDEWRRYFPGRPGDVEMPA